MQLSQCYSWSNHNVTNMTVVARDVHIANFLLVVFGGIGAGVQLERELELKDLKRNWSRN